MRFVLVDRNLVVAALDRFGGRSPRHPKARVILGEPDARGLATIELEGDVNATVESVLKGLDLPPPVTGQIVTVGRPAASQAMLNQQQARDEGAISSEPVAKPKQAPKKARPRYGREPEGGGQ